MTQSGNTPDHALDQLAQCTGPRLIGVRHHSSALARVMPALLAQFAPEAILIELPPDFSSWLEHLGDSKLETPVALAACSESQLISFYPLADFSPELAAIRWANQHQVPLIACDLDLSCMAALDIAPETSHEQSDHQPLLNRLMTQCEARDSGELWEKLVETPASNASPEAIRRAALLFGWLARTSSGGPSAADAQREAAMRRAIAVAPANSVAVIGSFHAAALLPEPMLFTEPPPLEQREEVTSAPATSLIPYSFAQLDSRSGYPAGVMDPVWHQAMLEAGSPTAARELIARFAVELCRHLRSQGHVASTPDASEIARMSLDLSHLRGHAAPGRGELLEAIESALVQGDLHGRGRAVAAAAQAVLVGKRRGRLPPGTPRSGLAVQIEATVARLKLPGPEQLEDDPREMRIDPLRSRLDRARAVVFRRLNLLGVPYAKRVDTQGTGHRENLTEVWQVQWTHGTSASVEAAGMHGITLVQAAGAALRRMRENNDPQSDQEHPRTTLSRLTAAAECGLRDLVQAGLRQLNQAFLHTASAAELIEAASVLQRMAAGLYAGLPLVEVDTAAPDVELFAVEADQLNSRPLLIAALRDFHALRGSQELDDVASLIDLTAIVRGDWQPPDQAPNHSSLLPSLQSLLVRLRNTGSPLMQGAAWGALAMLSAIEVDRLHTTLVGWYDAASTPDLRKQLRTRLAGLILPLLPLVFTQPEWLSGLEQRLACSTDDDFLNRLPALRGGFQAIQPADRVSLLNDRLAVLETDGPQASRISRTAAPEQLALATQADRAGRTAVAELLPDFSLQSAATKQAFAPPTRISEPPGEITLADRWRLVLGVKGCNSAKSRRAASTLDQLYGGSTRAGRGPQDDLSRGGTEEAEPSPREWLADVNGLFGKDICEEVVAEAAAGGRAALLEHIDPNTVRPSIDLLQQVLSLRGALPERELTLLRKLARKITQRLAAQLANRLRPALTGFSTARPTRRRSRRLDFAQTLRRNLHTAYRRADGKIKLAPRRLIFRSPARKQMDWHVIFVVDVSGSMEASIIYSSLVAAIFSALPAVDVRFFTFSTSVIDFTGAVEDPLSLLMEVQVGGGTHIGLGLRAARGAVKNPSRTMVVLVSDFAEGVSLPEMLGEIRALADSGAKLIGLAALDDHAQPRYHAGNAAAAVAAGMPVAAVTPERLAQWVADQLRGAS